MDAMIWILISVAVAIVVLGILAIFFIKAREGKHKVDYYSLFIIGVIWVAVGILLNNSVLWILGFVFFVIGLANKDKWKKNRTDWKKITKKQKNILSSFLYSKTPLEEEFGICVHYSTVYRKRLSSL